jgi:putative ABC transport system ATP-binding protein
MLELQHIHKMYNPGTINEICLFEDFNLKIEDGQFVSVVGSNGSGKTSMLNIICGSIPVDAGKILVNGVDISRQKDYIRHRRIGRVFQDPSKGTCPSMTILENLAIADNKGKAYGLGRGTNHARMDAYRELLASVGLGLEDKMHTKVGALSGGQRQALTLLMATIKQPKLLLLDEHTAALDPKTAKNVLTLTQKIIAENHLTAMMVTHNMKDALEYGNRTIMMHEGKIILDIDAETKKRIRVEDLLVMFEKASGSEINNDRMLLG